MAEPADFVEAQLADGTPVLRLTGDWTIATIGETDRRLSALTSEASANVAAIDLAAIGHIDTVGAWLIHRTAQRCDAEIRNADADDSRLIATVGKSDQSVPMRPERGNPVIFLLDEIGEATLFAFATLAGLIGFMGSVIAATGRLLLNPGKIRWNAIIHRFDMAGVRALGIIGLMSFLIGVVVAQQGAVQLRQFGAEAFTINLVGRLTFRELGILMTAIMVAGRSGSAFAAQIGTMKLTEEIDAMRTIGVSPIEALVIPRLLAVVLLLPLLGFFASLMAILGGGLLSWVELGIPPATFFPRIREVVPLTDVLVGLVKAPVFGIIIALTGCYQGMLVKSNAEEVGKRTTAAVVQAIFLVIVLDAFFAVFFTSIGWD